MSNFTNTTEHILYLHKQDMNSYDIVVVLCEKWGMTPMSASIIVDYVFKEKGLSDDE